MPKLTPSPFPHRVFKKYSSLLKKGVDDDGQNDDDATNEKKDDWNINTLFKCHLSVHGCMQYGQGSTIFHFWLGKGTQFYCYHCSHNIAKFFTLFTLALVPKWCLFSMGILWLLCIFLELTTPLRRKILPLCQNMTFLTHSMYEFFPQTWTKSVVQLWFGSSFLRFICTKAQNYDKICNFV